MKKIIYVVALVVLFASCGTNTKSDYEKAIADYVQTDKGGRKYDLQFKVIELNEQRNITVADSIAILTEEFKAGQQIVIDRMALAKEMGEDLLKNENAKRSPQKSEIEKYTEKIASINGRIDSLRNLTPTNLKGYENRNANDILAVVVRCKYSVILPTTSTRMEETSDFTLSADGKQCYAKSKVE